MIENVRSETVTFLTKPSIVYFCVLLWNLSPSKSYEIPYRNTESTFWAGWCLMHSLFIWFYFWQANLTSHFHYLSEFFFVSLLVEVQKHARVREKREGLLKGVTGLYRCIMGTFYFFRSDFMGNSSKSDEFFIKFVIKKLSGPVVITLPPQ